MDRLTQAILGWQQAPAATAGYVLGVLPGEGIGPEVVAGTLQVLKAVTDCHDLEFDIRTGGKIGASALRDTGHVLPPDVEQFCRDIFADRGAILCGPGGSRFVYELRERFDLFCKLIPIRPTAALRNAGFFRPEITAGVDMLVVRENKSGMYFGEHGECPGPGGRRAFHNIHYDEHDVRRILDVAIRCAQARRGQIAVIHKPGGVPAISTLWRDVAEPMCRAGGVAAEFIEVDTANYRMLSNPRSFDVIAAANMYGDVLADGAAALLASRGMSYSANYSDNGVGVYQTAHGAAYDLEGKDLANPIGQIYSLAILLNESFGLGMISRAIFDAVDEVLHSGLRTADIMESGCTQLGSAAFSARVAESFRKRHAEGDLTLRPQVAAQHR
jgi:3-isopropylmalate dehydrogenase